MADDSSKIRRAVRSVQTGAKSKAQANESEEDETDRTLDPSEGFSKPQKNAYYDKMNSDRGGPMSLPALRSRAARAGIASEKAAKAAREEDLDLSEGFSKPQKGAYYDKMNSQPEGEASKSKDSDTDGPRRGRQAKRTVTSSSKPPKGVYSARGDKWKYEVGASGSMRVKPEGEDWIEIDEDKDASVIEAIADQITKGTLSRQGQ